MNERDVRTVVIDRPGKPKRPAQGKPHPAFVAIVREIEMRDGELTIPAERFEFWAKRLWVKFPRNSHPALYRQLGAVSIRLSEFKCMASLQVFALATLGMDADQATRAHNVDGFLASSGESTRRSANTMAASSVMPGFGPMPSEASQTGVGPRLRPARRSPAATRIPTRNPRRAPTPMKREISWSGSTSTSGGPSDSTKERTVLARRISR